MAVVFNNNYMLAQSKKLDKMDIKNKLKIFGSHSYYSIRDLFKLWFLLFAKFTNEQSFTIDPSNFTINFYKSTFVKSKDYYV